jgi:hypothetical protein
MKWKVLMTFFPRTSKRSSPPIPAYLPVPPLMGFTPGASGWASGPTALICPPGTVNVLVHSSMWAFSEGSSAGSVTTQKRSKRPTFSFPLSLYSGGVEDMHIALA